MDLKKIKQLIKLAKDEGLSELNYKKGDEKISLKLPFFAENIAPIYIDPSKDTTSGEKSAKEKSPYQEVTSPFVGTFYGATSPDAKPYVKVGDRVAKGQVLCIIEAMKIMNEIESDFSGEIVEICVENENYVEYDQVLFRIKP
ncbi:MAG: acetyl-CoA carboxylase biotin carboxyl carrier protein [Epsilonproteobacteria bacterium]|nr:MAG: acetyl-CoA carboxylase biotin carboxyl carrier protein [Campylobacterota bacterium]RLA65223.1 MAG: acetyl-CoA carboxylase biotin carboxyl carrier protein [Campylobacterota bacterium]